MNVQITAPNSMIYKGICNSRAPNLRMNENTVISAERGFPIYIPTSISGCYRINGEFNFQLTEVQKTKNPDKCRGIFISIWSY